MDGAIKLLFKHAIEALHASIIGGAAGDGAAAAASGNWKSIIKGL